MATWLEASSTLVCRKAANHEVHPYFSHFCLLRAAMITVAFFCDRHFATSKPIPEELPGTPTQMLHHVSDTACLLLRYTILFWRLTCNDGNAPGLIRHGLLGVEDIRMDTLRLTPTDYFACRFCADRCSLSETMRHSRKSLQSVRVAPRRSNPAG